MGRAKSYVHYIYVLIEAACNAYWHQMTVALATNWNKASSVWMNSNIWVFPLVWRGEFDRYKAVLHVEKLSQMIRSIYE